MRRLRSWLLRLVGTFRDAPERDIATELEAHLQLLIADNIRAGMAPEEARRRAILALGGIEQVKEQYRDRRGFPGIAHLIRDTRYAIRTLRRSPGFAIAAIVTLALGLGANIAIFRFVDAVLLKSLPVDHPEQLVLVRPYAFNYPVFREFSARNADVFSAVAARWTIAVNLTADGTTEYVPAELVSGTYFETLRVKPAVGRLLNPQDDGAEGAHPVCVISYGLWQRRFATDPSVIGRIIELNAKAFEIVGVTERGFSGADLHSRHDVQVPMSMTLMFAGNERDSNGWSWLTMFARLAPGVSVEHAQALLRARFEPKVKWQDRASLILADGRQGIGSLKNRFADPVLVAQLLSGCVLLIACANLASLLVARTSVRRHELAIRRSLGASRSRVISQMILETLVLTTISALVGSALAVFLDRVLGAMLTAPGSHINLTAAPSALGLTVTFGLVLVTTAAIGLLPALVATGDAPLDGLRDTPRTGSHTTWFSRGLVVVQVVVCLVLVFAAGLFARSLHNLRTIDLGLDPRQIVVMTANPERTGYSMERTRAFYAEWLQRARHVRGVSSVGLASITVMSGGMFAGVVTVPDAEPRQDDPNNNFNVVTPDYFQTVGMPLVAGRTFTERDDANAPAVAIVNERFVDHYWPNRSPIGRRITALGKNVEIVGLVRTAKYSAVREEPQITIYFPAAQRPVRELTLHARVVGNTSAATAALMESVRAIDARIPVYSVGVLEDHVNARLANERVLYVLSMLFAALALIVSCAGLYALVAYSVVRRTREIGIRLAVGAQRSEILGLFVRDSVALVGIGLALGIPLSFAATRQFSSMLYGLEPTSTSTLVLATAVLAIVAIVAAVFPAARATRVDPVDALRAQ